MFRGTGILIWEQARQTWKGVLALAATLVFFALLITQFRDLMLYIFAKNANLMVGTAFLPVIGAAGLLFLQEARGRVAFAYSRRMLVLPVHTYVLAGAPLLYRLFVTALLAAGASWIAGHVIKEIFWITPTTLLLLIAVAAVHALVLLVCGYGSGTGVALFIVCFLLTSPLLYPVYSAVQSNLSIPVSVDDPEDIPVITNAYIGAAIALLAAWAIAGYIGVRQARREVAEDRVGAALRTLQHKAFREGVDFDSAERAQSWYEWRRGAYLFPWLALALGLVLTFAFRITAERVETRFLVAANLLGIAPAVVACLVGYAVTRSASDYQWFVCARPLSTQAIARARLRAGIRAIGLGYTFLFIAFIACYKILFPSQPMLHSLAEDFRIMTTTNGSDTESIATLGVLAALSITATWTLFWIARSAGVVVWFAGAIVSGWAYFAGSLYVMDPETGMFVTPASVFVKGMSYVLGFVAVTVFAVAIRKGYLRPAATALIVATWLVLCLVAYRYADMLPYSEPLLIGTWMILPFVPLASIPLTLEWQRHQ